jgi:hypothetical protein
MGNIRPEAQAKYSLLTRDAQAMFLLLWTIADDQGRTLGNPRALSKALFPDDHLEDHVAHWLQEIEAAGLVRRRNDDLLTIAIWSVH